MAPFKPGRLNSITATASVRRNLITELDARWRIWLFLIFGNPTLCLQLIKLNQASQTGRYSGLPFLLLFVQRYATLAP